MLVPLVVLVAVLALVASSNALSAYLGPHHGSHTWVRDDANALDK